MPGKMTVLDRLIKEGRIKKAPFGNAKYAVDELSFPAIREMDGRLVGGTARKMTPEREVYQKGIEARLSPKLRKAEENVNETYENMDAFKDEWNDAVEQAKEDMLSDWQDKLEGAATDEPYSYSLEVEPSSTNLRDYWPNYHYREPDEIIEDFDTAQDKYFSARDERNYLRGPGGWMQEQTMTPRYRNYQRAMQQRAANMAMGRDLSRRYAIAYNNLLRRGLTPAEARMYMREYFGGR